jgi:glycerophosphoryl diester phosphodiesterase
MKAYSLLSIIILYLNVSFAQYPAGTQASRGMQASPGMQRSPGPSSGRVRVAARRVLVAAHRGDWRDAPENSLRAFIDAADLGADIVELDLQKTKDGEIVILHDQTLDRTSKGKGSPSDYTLAELPSVRLSSNQPPALPTSRPGIPACRTASSICR